MTRYGYTNYDRHYRVTPKDITLDTKANLLRITATVEAGFKPPVVAEFPLVLVRRCKDCGKPVSIYAQGSLAALRLQTGQQLFPEPWTSGDIVAIEQGGTFALIINRGHDGAYSWSGGCNGTELRVG